MDYEKKRTVSVYAVLAVVIGIFLAGCATTPSSSSTPVIPGDLLGSRINNEGCVVPKSIFSNLPARWWC